MLRDKIHPEEIMNRVCLSAFAAALLLALPANIPAQEKTMTTSTGMELVWILPGVFEMGSTQKEREWAKAKGCSDTFLNREGERPCKTEIKEAFWLGRTELTVGQWRKFVDATGYVTDAEKNGRENWRQPKAGFTLKDNHPVSCVSWNDAVAFCLWLTETETKANKLPAGMVYRLPTEAEWEYACRAGSQTKFWWGDQPDGCDARLNYYGVTDGFEYISPVDHYGFRGRNKFGLADMLGNVWEWCLDEADPAYAHGECWKGDPRGHVIRGGSCQQYLGFERCAVRSAPQTDSSANHFGFRVSCGVPGGSGHSLATNTSIARTSTEERKPAVAPVADPSLQKDAKKFARNQSIIKGLYVVKLDNGQRLGSAQDIIATAERVGSDRETICDFTGKVAEDTQISMEEAERLLKVRYPVWQAGYKIRFSYANKYAKQAGGSAGGAFAVLLQSLLDGFQIDPGYAMTGDVTVDGKIREIGAAAEKIRGAFLEKCKIVAIPAANKENLSDMALLYSPAMLWSAQLFSIATLDDAAAVARKDRTENLTKAIALFAEVQARLSPNSGAAALRSPWVYQSLREVLRLAPNHLSAEFMLRAANNQLPNALSLGESLEQIWAAAGPLLGFLFADYKEPEKSKRYYFDRVPKETTKMALERLDWLQMRLNPKTRDLKVAMVDYMVSLDQLHRASTFSSGTLRQHLEKRDRVLGEAHKLGVDRKVLEEMMH